MIPLVDLHCHLLGGLDDGPRTEDEALQMCRMACEDGTQLSVALAHQNEHYPAVTPALIREAAERLAKRLVEENIPMTVFPCAEVMVHPEVDASWRNGDLVSVADRGKYLLIEMPDGQFVELGETAARLRRDGVRPILAHPERHPEFLQDEGRIEELIRAGCLVQVSARSVTHPSSRRDERALRDWFKRGVVHVLGSDGHSPTRRRPKMGDAYEQIRHWVGDAIADRVCSTNGTAILHGLALRTAEPARVRLGWLPRLW